MQQEVGKMSFKQNRLESFIHSTVFWPVIALAAILLINLILTPGFFKIEMKDGHLFGSLIDILNRSSSLVIMSIGMTLVIATKGIDISVGAVVAIAGSVAATVLQRTDSVLLAILAALLASTICGLWNGVLVAKIGIQPMVGTLILMTVGRGIAQLITNGQIIPIDNSAYAYIGIGFLFVIPFTVYIVAAVIFLIYLITRKSAIGLFIESVGANETSSRFTGIRSSNIILITYVICGLLAGLAGIIISSNVKAADANNAGLWMELDAILATVIGGTSMNGGRFYLVGTVVGALFIQSLTTTIYSMGVPPEIINVVKALVVFIVSLLQSPEFRNLFIKQSYSSKKGGVNL